MAESAADRDAFLNPADFGSAATYTPLAGSASSINVLFDAPHTEASIGDIGVLQAGYRARISYDDIAAPADGDQIVIGAQTFLIRNARQDVTGKFWSVDLELQ